MYNLEFKLEKKDFLNLSNDLLEIQRYKKSHRINSAIVVFFTFWICIILIKGWISIAYGTLISGLIINIITTKTGEAMYHHEKAADLNHKFEFKQNGFSHNTCDLLTEYEYNDIKELYDTRNSVIMYLYKKIMIFIPKRTIKNIKLYEFIKDKTCL